MRRYAVFVGMIAVVWGACDKLSTFTISESAESTIEQGTILEDLVGDLGFGSFLDMDISQNTELRNQGIEPGDIREVRLESFVLEVTSPEGGDLSFLSDIAFYVESDGLPRERIASGADFAEGESRIELDLDDVDLTDYATAERMSIVTEVTGHRPDVDTVVKATVDLSVQATAQGACNAIEKE
jgi:hypothetical protein